MNISSILLGQDSNLYQINSKAGISIFTGLEIIKEDFDDKEKEEIYNAYKSIENIINYKKPSDSMSLKHYKRIFKK